jgi:hypothetical protein
MPRVLRAGQHFSVWITIDGVPAEIYGLVGPNYVNGVPRTTGWIASEAGKVRLFLHQTAMMRHVQSLPDVCRSHSRD